MSAPAFELAVPVGTAEHVLASTRAPVTLVEYGDFECPNCKQAAPAVRQLLEKYAGRLRLVYRHFPLDEVHPHAVAAALAAEGAAVQDKFWPMHDLLFDNQAHLTARHLRSYAERLGLDMARYDTDVGRRTHWHRVREHIDGALRSGVRATPTFFVDGRLQDVSFGLQHLAEGIEMALRP